MENATRAFIMAATMLLGVMLLGLLVWVFRAGGKLGQSYDLRQYRNSLTYFNSKLFAFDKVIKVKDGVNSSNYDNAEYVFASEGNTISDVVSAVNLAYDYNKQFSDNLNNCEIYICDASGNYQYYLYNSPFNITDSSRIIPQNSVVKKGNSATPVFVSLNDILRLHVDSQGHFTDDESCSSIKEMKILSNGQVFYKYYFETIAHVNSTTNRIDRMAFVLVEMDGSNKTISLTNETKSACFPASLHYTFHEYTIQTLHF